MANDKLFWCSAALCLPTVALLVAGTLFYAYDVPRIEDNERESLLASARKYAEELKGSRPPDFIWEYGKGVVTGDKSYAVEFPSSLTWKDWQSAGPKRKAEMWGVKKRRSGTLVWTRRGAHVYGCETELSQREYRALFLTGGIVTALVLVALTAIAIRYFRSYIKSRDDYLAATAHDLTTPLVGMRLCIGRNDEESKALNERLIRIVENIKDFLRLGGRRKEAEKENFDILDAYGEAYAVFREDYRDLFDGKDVEIKADADRNVVADRTLTVQILWNLLGNDLKYAAPYGAVRVRVRDEGRFVAVDFEDEGQGMSPRQMRRAFDRYYRAKSVLQSGKGGFGIGLCTSREAAVLMGGSLTVRANKPSGCVFTLRLPSAAKS